MAAIPAKRSDDFRQKLKEWFENKGIINNLIVYLRSQLFKQLQNKSNGGFKDDQQFSPRAQAIKLLLADFLLQHELLFTLSVFCSEVPVLLKVKEFSNYVICLADADNNQQVSSRLSKPKFSDADVSNIFLALGLKLTTAELKTVITLYRGEFNSLLDCLMNTMPTTFKKYRISLHKLDTIRKKMFNFKRLSSRRKVRLQKMYEILQQAHDTVIKHKYLLQDMKQKEDLMKYKESEFDLKIADVLKRTTELESFSQDLKEKEGRLDSDYQSRFKKYEEKMKILEEKERFLHSKYETLEKQREELAVEKELLKNRENQFQAAIIASNDTSKLMEYEEKFRILQNEVYKILDSFELQIRRRKWNTREHTTDQNVQYSTETISKTDVSKKDVGLKEHTDYIRRIETENESLKISFTQQKHHVTQLTKEMLVLKTKLELMETEMTRIKTGLLKANTIADNVPKSRRKLFVDGEKSSSDLTSSSAKESSSLTDDIVTDAKRKLKNLENETESVNRNLKHLSDVLTRNIAFNEDRLDGSSSRSGGETPSERYYLSARFNQARVFSANDRNSSSNNSLSSSPKRSTFGDRSFKRLFLSQRERKKLAEEDYDVKSPESEIPISRCTENRVASGRVGVVEDMKDSTQTAELSSDKVLMESHESNKDEGTTNTKCIEVEREIDSEVQNKENLKPETELAFSDHITDESIDKKSEGEISVPANFSNSSDFWK